MSRGTLETTAEPCLSPCAPEICRCGYWDGFPRVGRPKSKPCGECHLRPGETCDICGAKAVSDFDRTTDAFGRSIMPPKPAQSRWV